MDLSELIPASVTWGDVILALLVVVAGWILSRFARKGVTVLMARAKGLSATITTLVARFVSYGILLLAIGIALALLGANVQPLLAIVIIVAVVVVLVLRGVADNFASGVLIQSRRTVDIGDELQIDGPDGLVTGRVIELNARAVVVLALDGRTIHVPNSKLLSDSLINDSRHGARRSEVQVRIARAGAAVDDLAQHVADAAASVDGVHSREPVRALVTAVSPERVTLRVQFWHHPLQGVPITSDVVRAIAAALETAQLAGTVTSDDVVAPLVPSDGI